MKTINELEVGDKVWFPQYSGVRNGTIVAVKERSTYRGKKVCVDTGTIVAVKERSTYRGKKVCVDTGDEWVTVEVETEKIFLSYRDAQWARANKLQLEASSKLQEAANAFKDAGAPQVETAEPAQ